MKYNWKNKENRSGLLACKTDKELQKKFPDATIESLRRLQRKFRSRTPAGKKIERTILLPDIHHPFYNAPAINAIKKFIAWFKPHRIVLVGDALEMRAIDHWKREKGNTRAFEGIRLLHDYKCFIDDILQPLEELCPNAELIYLGGNHEEWAYQLVDKFPQLEGIIEPEVAMKLEERGWKWIPYVQQDKSGNLRRGMLRIGKLTVIHGNYTNKFHSSKTADTFSKSVCYGHSHDFQAFTKVHVEDPGDYHTAQSIGCLCDKSPQFMKGRPNRWVHCFGILYTRPSGHFNLYTPIIINGQFIFSDKLFDGNKS